VTAGGEVRVFADYAGDVREEADVVVVGSGPCGAVVAKELAEAGRRVVLVEEGPPFTPSDFALDGALSMARTMREGGLRATRGYVMPTLQAICLGGGSLVNSAICVRPPDFVFDAWCEGFELSRTTGKDLAPHFDAVSAFLGVAPTPDDVQGARNLLFRDGCRALDIPSEPIARNVRGCRGSGECFTGCRSRAKQSMDLSYVPAAIRAGARVLTSVQVQQVRAEGTRALGIEGQVVAPFGGPRSHRVRVDAKVVVLSAGVMATPVLLQKSGNLANRSDQVGRNLQFHPGVMVTGVFPESVRPEFGATQGYQSLHFLGEGFKLETFWAPPTALALRMPGMGAALMQRLAELPRSATWDAILSCHRSLGTVRPRRGASLDPAITWQFHPDDVPLAGRAMSVLAEIFAAAGAEKVITGVHGLPDELPPREAAGALARRTWRATDVVTGSTHVFCTTRMHGDPRRGVVDELGRCHDLDNLYVADTGVFPRCSSVNPMLTGMALAHRTAGAIRDRV
jgi:choline dehydrogenase-like flavoprotein